jgi:chemotaxis protein CheZ
MSAAPERARAAPVAEQRDVLRHNAAALIIAIDEGDATRVDEALRELIAPWQDGLFRGVARLTRHLHEDLEDLRHRTLAKIADGELPDACASLDHVMQLTDRAAHSTLDFVEEGRALAKRIQDAAAALAVPADHPGTGDELYLRRVENSRIEFADSASQLRKHLSDLALAQGYQDITGQIIRRVIALVRRLEGALVQLLRDSAPAGAAAAADAASAPDGLLGPAVPGVGKPSASQTEADLLLSNLGL